MTFQLQIDKNPFEFHIAYIGMNPLRQDGSTRTKDDIAFIRHVTANDHVRVKNYRHELAGALRTFRAVFRSRCHAFASLKLGTALFFGCA
jgi:hypothetical protein